MTTSYLSISEFPGDGVTTEWEFNFAGGYISRDHVLAYTASPSSVITPVDITSAFISDFKIVVSPPVPAGHKLRVYRSTPRAEPLVNFTGGSNFTEANLDLLARQTIFAAAEAFDAGAYASVNDLISVVAEAADLAGTAASAAAASAVSAAASAVSAAASATDAAALAVPAVAQSFAMQSNYLGDWTTATAYTRVDAYGKVNWVRGPDLRAYRIVSNHTSGVFATDLAAGKFLENDTAQLGIDLLTVGAGKGAEIVGSDDESGGALWTTVKGFISYVMSSAGSSVLGFVSNGIHAVRRSVEEKLREYPSVKDYGAVGDGVTDDTAAIQKALDANKYVIVTDGVYLIDPDVGLTTYDGQTLSFRDNAIFSATPTSSGGYAIIRVHEVSGVRILSPKIIGERDLHTGDYGESGMGISVKGSSNVKIIDADISKCWGDGVYLGKGEDSGLPCTYVTVVDSRIFDNRRNNLSIVYAENTRCIRSKFTNANGTSPEFGVDIEPNSGEYVDGAYFDHCEFSGNAGNGISAFITHGSVSNIELNGCKSINNGAVGFFGGGSVCRVTSSEFTGNGREGVWAQTLDDLTLSDCLIENNGLQTPSFTGAEVYIQSCLDAKLIGTRIRGGANVGRAVGGLFVSANDGRSLDVLISGCSVSGINSYGVSLQGAKLRATIKGSVIEDTASDCLASEGIIESLQIIGASLRNPSRVSTGKSYVTVSTLRTIISGCIFQWSGLGNSPKYGVRRWGGHTIVTGNVFAGYSDNAIYPTPATLPDVVVDANNIKSGA